MPLEKTARLGSIITGNNLYFLRFKADRIKEALTNVPTNNCGCPIKKGIKKHTAE